MPDMDHAAILYQRYELDGAATLSVTVGTTGSLGVWFDVAGGPDTGRMSDAGPAYAPHEQYGPLPDEIQHAIDGTPEPGPEPVACHWEWHTPADDDDPARGIYAWTTDTGDVARHPRCDEPADGYPCTVYRTDISLICNHTRGYDCREPIRHPNGLEYLCCNKVAGPAQKCARHQPRPPPKPRRGADGRLWADPPACRARCHKTIGGKTGQTIDYPCKHKVQTDGERCGRHKGREGMPDAR
jgi:hypothetical protein